MGGTARRGQGGLQPCPFPSSLYQMTVRAHPSTASVSITVLLYDGLLLCGFNVAIKGLTFAEQNSRHFFANPKINRQTQ